MITLTLSEIAAAVSGDVINASENVLSINSVSTDTRSIEQGDLFIALKGDAFDAHAFLPLAEKSGASVLLVSDLSQIENISIPLIYVKDTRIALGLLSHYVKEQIKELKSVAITGSNGKTTTKEMVNAILTAFSNKKEAILATAGNFNNDIGVPLTLLRLTKEIKYAIVELGANHKGEIAYTANLVQPDVALINNVMPAHLEGFGSIEGIAQAKGEIWNSLGEQGVAVVNFDDRFASEYIATLNENNTKIMTFSQQKQEADVWAGDQLFDDQGRASFELGYQDKSVSVLLNLAGQHNVSNALAAASISLALGCDLENIAKGLNNLQSVKGRVNHQSLSRNSSIIDDTYNANSASMKAAISLLLKCKGQHILVLGAMGELGRDSLSEHQSVGYFAAEQNITDLLTVGEGALAISQAFTIANGKNGLHFSCKADLIQYLRKRVEEQQSLNNIKHLNQHLTLLVKGSRSAKMEDIVNAMTRSFN